jgi:hypothetical protein
MGEGSDRSGKSFDRRQREARPGEPGFGSVVDRRSGVDRRAHPDASSPTGFERRRGAGRRLTDFTKAAEEGEHTREQHLFVQAIEAFKRANGKTFPTWTDVLEVVRLLGYRKTRASEVSLLGAEDWTERADAPSNVRTRTPDPTHNPERDREADRDAA